MELNPYEIALFLRRRIPFSNNTLTPLQWDQCGEVIVEYIQENSEAVAEHLKELEQSRVSRG